MLDHEMLVMQAVDIGPRCHSEFLEVGPRSCNMILRGPHRVGPYIQPCGIEFPCRRAGNPDSVLVLYFSTGDNLP